ncbi:hypothetical protein HDU67_006025, partial [Dinochytrium kinnereticum]
DAKSAGQKGIASLLQWFDQNNIVIAKNVIDVCEIGKTVKVCALKDVEAGTVVAKIPRSAVLCVGSCGISEDIETAGMEDILAGLALAFLYEKGKGKASKWHGYISHLPQRVHLPVFWGEEEVKRFKGTDLEGRIDELKDQIVEDFDKEVYPFIQANLKSFPMFNAETPREKIAEAFNDCMSVVMARRVEVDDDIGYGLVPFLDLLSHSSTSANVNIYTDEDFKGGEEDDNDEEMPDLVDDSASKKKPEDDTLDLIATTDLMKSQPLLRVVGEEVPTSTLLLQYAICEPNPLITNPSDTVVLDKTALVKVVFDRLQMVEGPNKAEKIVAERLAFWVEEGRKVVETVSVDIVEEYDDMEEDEGGEDDDQEEQEKDDHEEDDKDEEEEPEVDASTSDKPESSGMDLDDGEESNEETDDDEDDDDSEDDSNDDDEDDEDDKESDPLARDPDLCLLSDGNPSSHLRCLLHLLLLPSNAFRRLKSDPAALFTYLRQLVEPLIVGPEEDVDSMDADAFGISPFGWRVVRTGDAGEGHEAPAFMGVKATWNPVQVLTYGVLGEVVRGRDEGYFGEEEGEEAWRSLEEDEEVVIGMEGLDDPKRWALCLRVRERRILERALVRWDNARGSPGHEEEMEEEGDEDEEDEGEGWEDEEVEEEDL